MKNLTVTSGKFSAIGNLQASDILGKKIFIHKNLLDSAGITPATIKYPFFAVWKTEQIGQLDPITRKPIMKEDGVTPFKVDRDEATAIFLTKDAIKQAHVDNDSLDREIETALREASSAGLSQASINKLSELV